VGLFGLKKGGPLPLEARFARVLGDKPTRPAASDRDKYRVLVIATPPVTCALLISYNHIVSRLLILATRVTRFSWLARFNYPTVRWTTATARLKWVG
jgi:hypothetical protein